MSGTPSLCQVACNLSMMIFSPSVGSSPSPHFSRELSLAGRSILANSSLCYTSCYANVTRATSSRDNLGWRSADSIYVIDGRPQMGTMTREARGVFRKRKQVITCSALAPASKLEKEYDYDSPKMKELMAFLKDDLIHLFDDQGIDKSMYDRNVDFKDPITKYGSLDGYLFNIQMLRLVLTPKFELHSVKQTGPTEITTRWTMTMYFLPLPWKPELVFTGTSVMGVNEETGKFCRHWDFWDSIDDNEYFSLEGVRDLLKQLRIYKTPDLETPKYKVLKRTSLYEVRQYEEFLVAETPADKLVGNKGFNEVAGYLFGKNSTGEKMKMTTPVFNQSLGKSSQLQFVLPLQSELSSVPSPLSENVKVRPVGKKIGAVMKFSGEAAEDIAMQMETILRGALVKDGLKPEDGLLLARYNDPGRTWAFLRRNEVIIWLEDFTLQTV